MTKQLFGTKQGMTTFFDEKGNLVVCTLITVDKHIAVQVKTEDGKDGYSAIQYGARTQKPKHTTKPLAGHFKKAGVEPRKKLFEVRFKGDAPHQVGDEVGLELFEGLTHVDVIGKSKGKGFQGVIKRYGFKGGPAAHGSKFHRSGGSTGCRSTPGRCLPGTKKPGHMGNEQVTVQSLKVIKCDAEKGVLLVKGAVPGAKGSAVYVCEAIKKVK
ncbi:MAG: 50S ribosomal protein L3 [Chlamydiia bacterium]|nr:50S ribosomal protein L3 [Chlamydiia bacterium]MCP5509310.1 50S ribosomal protein L3 [Chlamydiales bacterium]HPE85051.1 50S ribosomal protein L3 [Chlamydiales bacterium]